MSESNRREVVAEAIKLLLSTLRPIDREPVLQALFAEARPILAPRAGRVLDELTRIIPLRRAWTIDAIKQELAERSCPSPQKHLYNCLGYLTRKGHLNRVGYGEYRVPEREKGI